MSSFLAPEKRNCAIDIMNVISSFAWISHFSVQAVDNCAETGSTEARCGADISALVAAIAMTPAAGYATTSATRSEGLRRFSGGGLPGLGPVLQRSSCVFGRFCSS